MQNNLPKQYMLLAGKPVIMHSLERIDKLENIQDIIIVCSDEHVSFLQCMIKQYMINTPVRFASAGDTRQASVMSGLALVQTDSVIIHEAARPFVSIADFQRLMDIKSPNAMLGIDIPFTVIKGHKYMEGQLNRAELVNVQLPQKFNTGMLYKAHCQADRDGKLFTEDASLFYNYFPDTPIEIVNGAEYNLKLTTPMDMLLGELIYENEFRRRK